MIFQYAYVSIKSIDCILVSWLILISSVKALCFSFLNLFYMFNINLLLLINSLWFSLTWSISNLFFSGWFILFSNWVTSKPFLLFSNLSFLFMTHFFVPLAFFSSLPSQYVKSIRIWSYSGQHFLAVALNRRDSLYLSIFSPNTARCRPE